MAQAQGVFFSVKNSPASPQKKTKKGCSSFFRFHPPPPNLGVPFRFTKTKKQKTTPGCVVFLGWTPHPPPNCPPPPPKKKGPKTGSFPQKSDAPGTSRPPRFRIRPPRIRESANPRIRKSESIRLRSPPSPRRGTWDFGTPRRPNDGPRLLEAWHLGPRK